VVLVDSSVYIQLLRKGKNPVTELAAVFDITEMVTCGVVCVEVLRGVVRPRVRTYLRRFFDMLIDVPMSRDVWRSTEELAWNLDRRGLILPLTDLLIATCAFRAGASLLTYDWHFESVPGLRLSTWPTK